MSRECAFVFLLLLGCSAGNYTHTLWEHRCDPGSEIFACTAPNFLYKPNQNHSTLIVPETVRKVRLAYPTDKVIGRRDIITAYDATLHAALNRPLAVQITYVSMEHLEVPLDLEYADFSHNSIERVNAPPVNGSNYALRYLDLGGNGMDRIDSLSALVNLETLLLSGNHISTLDDSVLKSFTKLSTLNLASNSLVDISFTDMPASLEFLILRHNLIYGTLEFTGVNLPALKVLDVYNNLCGVLEVSALLSAAPKLEAIRLDGNYFSVKDAKAILEQLTDAGIEHDKFAKSNREEDDDEDHYFRTQQKLKVQEHIISGMLTVVNVCVIGWGFYQVYKSRGSTERGRETSSSV
uniref:Leucine rich immune protein (Coil-less) n=1 Tax=Anopheles culicifacies TaxID=139723 RepID=A0A182M0W8_9DIPT